MYTVFLADDEPTALEYMEAIIEKKCPDYRIIGTAGDGWEALEKVRELKPDVLIFDICMPVMDGLELSARMREEGSEVLMIVVSGYSEFDYARTALQNGCMDYLLKPIVPKDAQKIFGKVTRELEKRYSRERHKLLSHVCQDGKIREEDMIKYFGGKKYYMALVRYNGLPARLSGGNGREVFSEPHEIIITYGRDESESLYLFPEELVLGEKFEDIVMRRAKKELMADGYYTVILSEKPVACEKIGETASAFYRCLGRNVILGKTHIVNVDGYQEKKIEIENDEQIMLEDFRYHVEKSEDHATEQIMVKLLTRWMIKERPLLWIEHQVRNMAFQMKSAQYRFANDMDYAQREYAIEELFSDAATEEQFIAGVRELLFCTKQEEKRIEKLDTGEFMQQVEAYLLAHLENASAARDATKEFGISYTYLGVLFQKYKGMSIKNYMTTLRMEKAKKIMAHDSSVLIRDVAERIGYSDQFYFSRVFRSCTGMCPSDYMDSLKNER